ncbi:hypothetical protein [Cognatilysobacter lacus]|uniref:Uncharacterized protein n=1 Tax=Cognatilysobacter lacus TaxID=1643323 RepID=A0A5D8Z2Q0_9GAMM|nr:hypothetical protein [Lysobacter lacus]TZF86984.1 hypothetical protein FW784_11730 [Lysobacter lacus]
MNALLTTEHPLPRCIYQGGDPSRRRRHLVEGFRIDPSAVDRFNRLLRQFADTAPVLDADRLATAARELSSSARGATAACIRERLFRVKAAQTMAADAAWQAPPETVELVRRLIEQVRRGEHLLPERMHPVGHLDDAVLVDAAWPQLRRETLGYADFHRLRRLAFDRAQRDRFDRAAWRQAQLDEARLLDHARECREGSYLPESAPRFAVH